jgi:hypothetical protein
LQLVGGALIDALPPGRKTITLDDYVAAGRAEGVLRGYMERLLERFTAENRRIAQRVIEGLVRADQTRDVRTIDSLRDELQAQNVPTENLSQVIKSLQDNHVLRIVDLDDHPAYELVHDFLAQQVQLDPEIAARKAAQELLDRRVRDYESYGSLLTEQELGVIAAQQNQLRLTDASRRLISQTRAPSSAKANHRRADYAGRVGPHRRAGSGSAGGGSGQPQSSASVRNFPDIRGGNFCPARHRPDQRALVRVWPGSLTSLAGTGRTTP